MECGDSFREIRQNLRESVTVSVFVLSGSQLKATYSLEGPVASLDVDSGIDLYTKAQEFAVDRRNRRQLSFSQEVDFEHLMDEIDDDDEFVDDDDDDDEFDDDKPINSNDPDAEKKKRERRERQRKKFLELKKKRDKKQVETMKKLRQDGEPILKTNKAPAAGWYRMCVTSNWNQVSNADASFRALFRRVFSCTTTFAKLRINTIY